MKNWFIVLFLLYLSLFLQANEVQNAYDDLDNLLALPEKVAKVSDFLITKDVANFHLKEGNLYLLSPVNEQYVAALFKGEGKVTIEPSTKFARDRLYAELQMETIDDSFDYLLLFFSNEFYQGLIKNLSFENGIIDKEISQDIKTGKRYLYDDKSYHLPLLKSLLNKNQTGYFYAHVISQKSKDLFFEFDPTMNEEVSISAGRKQRFVTDFFHNNICLFHRQEDYLSNEDMTLKNTDEIEVQNYVIDSNISPRLEFSGVCTIDFTGKKNAGKWLEFFILPKMNMISVQSDNNQPLSFFKGEDSQVVWIEMAENIQENQKYQISIEYEGDLIERGSGGIKFNTYHLWYPYYPSNKYNHYELTFQYPKSYKLVSVGEKVTKEKKDKMIKEKWVTKYPVNFASLNLGKFKHEDFQHPDIPQLSLYMNKNIKKAKADVANSMSFYQTVYGDCIYDNLVVTEIPVFLSGIAFPGLINFYSDEFIKNALYKVHYDIHINAIDFVQLRAHEVAHQWWGCAVQPRTYRDMWLAEGLAEFSSIWFIQTSLHSNNDYFEYLSKWKTSITDASIMNAMEKKGDAPVWLGNRAPYHVYYKKAAWVFHMLRMLMINLDTYSEDDFKAMMQDFYQTYKGSTASTDDFKKIVEKHLKTDMTWFFAQWIYGNEIPELSFDYSVTEKDNGKYVATCKFTQNNVKEDFKSYIPIEIDFGNNQKVRRRIVVEGKERILEIALPLLPEKIEFNIQQSVLSK